MKEAASIQAEALKPLEINTETLVEKTRPNRKEQETHVVRLEQAEEGRTNAELRNVRDEISCLLTTPIEPSQAKPLTIEGLQGDRQQTERALDTTRTALEREVTAREEAAKPRNQDDGEGRKQPAEAITPEQELLYLVSKSDGRRIPITVPRNYTKQDLTHAIQALGGKFEEYEAGYTWTPQGVLARFRGIWRSVKKAFQASTPPSSYPPVQKTA